MANVYKQFANKVTKAIEKDKILKELKSKEQSNYIKNAIAIWKSAILVSELKKAEGLDFGNLTPEAKQDLAEIMPIYKSTVKAMEQANKVLGNQPVKTQAQDKSMEL